MAKINLAHTRMKPAAQTRGEYTFLREVPRQSQPHGINAVQIVLLLLPELLSLCIPLRFISWLDFDLAS